MTSFLQKIYQLGNLPEGIRKEEQNTSDILKNLFNHEKIQTDYKNLSTNKENSILMILSHFTHKKEDGSVIFEN
ncbi:hypothetical protein IJM86_01535 [bacterium]|nr:hypothetical protein [bacterium]